jgi:membrane-bound metal-dependent hydrolase YbcI (DUF457 family)
VHPDPAWPFLSDPAHPFLSAVWAVLIHGMIGIAVVSPLIWQSRRRVTYASIAFVGGSILDLDHFIDAGSLNLHTIETLGDRPDTHSLAFVALVAVLTLAISRRPQFAWALFAVNASHLLFDAAGSGEHILYPFSSLDSVPWLACPIGDLGLLAVSAAVARFVAARWSESGRGLWGAYRRPV